MNTNTNNTAAMNTAMSAAMDAAMNAAKNTDKVVDHKNEEYVMMDINIKATGVKAPVASKIATMATAAKETSVGLLKKTGSYIWQNKGKIALAAIAVGAAVYYKDEITELASDFFDKATDVAEDTLVSQAD